MTIYRGYEIRKIGDVFRIFFEGREIPGYFKFEEGAMDEIDRMKRAHAARAGR
jgi:hypothetical protein